MSSQMFNLTPELYQYLQSVSLREPPILQELRHATQKLSMGQMQISPEQGQLMGLLIQLIGAKKALEIGTFTGYSALVVALALPADGMIITCDVNTEWTSIAKTFWQKAGVINKIKLKIAPALETLQALLDTNETGTFDFAFIDADKANYSAYYEYALKLIRSGGLIAIDNVLWSGAVADQTIQNTSTRALRALNEFIFQDERVNISMLPIGDGLTLARKK